MPATPSVHGRTPTPGTLPQSRGTGVAPCKAPVGYELRSRLGVSEEATSRMNGVPLESGQAADLVVHWYRELVVLARTKHCLLRAGRLPDAVRLADQETQILAHLAMLELSRRLVTSHLPNGPAPTRSLRAMELAKASLIRRLRPVARANQALKRAIGPSPSSIGDWAGQSRQHKRGFTRQMPESRGRRQGQGIRPASDR